MYKAFFFLILFRWNIYQCSISMSVCVRVLSFFCCRNSLIDLSSVEIVPL